MKNWLPSLVKNLEPLAEIVGSAATLANSAAAAANIDVLIAAVEEKCKLNANGDSN